MDLSTVNKNLISEKEEVKEMMVFVIEERLRRRGGSCNAGPCDEAMEFYHKMFDLGITLNKFTFPFVLKTCSGLKVLEIGKEIYSHVKRSGLDSDVYICTALVDFYAKCGCLYEAKDLFDKRSHKDVVAWNAMIAGSSLHGRYEDTVRLIFEMQDSGTSPNSSTLVAVLPTIGQAKALRQGKSMHGYCVRKVVYHDVVMLTALLDMYAKCDSLEYARRIFGTISVAL
ncbi:hypothetical protein IFM89_026001 [Coptis chinensis]|uniref:Pentatricopeptide repeat-containing protein n=1 Tax=Coptis chinensis TaxID=261450 RepID=A0A835I025_9MAGN|nr:hypothetical protein IFM89_026001 [Coptis chinensis]